MKKTRPGYIHRRKERPTSNQSFLAKSGLHVYPNHDFVIYFRKTYQSLLKKNKNIKKCLISEEDARYMIVCICEAIIYCLDFGISILFKKLAVFGVKTAEISRGFRELGKTDKKYYQKPKFYLSNARKKKRINIKLNPNNKEYLKIIKKQIETRKESTRYSAEFYGKKVPIYDKKDDIIETIDGLLEDGC